MAMDWSGAPFWLVRRHDIRWSDWASFGGQVEGYSATLEPDRLRSAGTSHQTGFRKILMPFQGKRRDKAASHPLNSGCTGSHFLDTVLQLRPPFSWHRPDELQ